MIAKKHLLSAGKRRFLGFNLCLMLLFFCLPLYSYPQLYYSPHEEMDTTTVSFSPDGKYILSAGFQGDFRLWETDRCELQGIGFIPDPRIPTTESGSVLQPHSSLLKGILSLAWSPDGDKFVIGLRDGTVRMYAIHPPPNGKPLFEEQAVFDEHVGGLRAVAYSSTGKYIASAGHDEAILLQDAHKIGLSVKRFCCHSPFLKNESWIMVNTLDFSTDEKFLASGSADRTVKVWETHSGKNIRTFEVPGLVYAVAFSPNGRTIAASSFLDDESSIFLWDRETGKEERKLNHPGGSWSIHFSPDGHFLVSGGYNDGKVMIWDLQSGEPIQTLSSPEPQTIRSLSLSPDGQFLVSGHTRGPLPLWNMQTGKMVREFGKCSQQ